MASYSKCNCGPSVPSEFYQIEQNVTNINNNPPYPDPSGSGYWMIYDPASKAYKLSDVKMPTYTGSIDLDGIIGGDSTDFTPDVHNKILTTHIQSRSDTEANWQSNDPLLELGEFGLTTDGENKGRFKIGDGVNSWSALAYYGSGASGDYVTVEMLQNGEVRLPTASFGKTGAVMASTDTDCINVNPETGCMQLNDVSISKLSQEDGTVLVLNGGDADDLQTV